MPRNSKTSVFYLKLLLSSDLEMSPVSAPAAAHFCWDCSQLSDLILDFKFGNQ